MTTPHDPAHEPWEELAAGYALHALEPDEEAELLAHLETCARCRQLLDEHEFVAAQLGALVEDTEARPPTWSSIRAGVLGADTSPVVSLDAAQARRAWRTRRSARVLGAAAALVLLAGAATAGWQLSRGSTSAVQEAITQCASAPACTVVRLPNAGHEKAAVLVSDGTARVVPTDLPAPVAGRVYVLWQLPRAAAPGLVSAPRLVSPLRAFRSDHPTPAAALAMPYADTAGFAISLERADAVPAAPTVVVAVGTA